MNTIKNFLLFLFVGAVIAGCSKVTYHKTPGGMPYQLYKGKSTQKIYAGNFVKISFTQKVNDSVYFTTAGQLPIYMPINKETQPYDISEVWTKLKVGDSVVATQMMDTFIKRAPQNIPPNFKNGDRIVTYVKVLAVFTSDSAVAADETKAKQAWLAGEIAFLGKYLADKNITAQKTPSGAYVQMINPGTGDQIDSGKYVSVNYTGTSFSGKRFDSNTDTTFHHVEPYSFTVGAGQMIKGFDEAVRIMKNGGSAKVYIPSLLAYGDRPGTPLIKPYEHLIFDIAVVDVKDNAPPVAPQRTQPKVDAPQPKK